MDCNHVIPTGFQSLDKALGGGFYPGSLNIIAARPAMGKTTFVFQCAAGMAKSTEKKIYIQSLEMSSENIERRFPYLSNKSGIIMDDSAPIAMTQLCAKLARIPNLGAVILDRLQLIGPEVCIRKPEVMYRILFELKMLSKEFGIPVICTSPLPRTLERRRNHRPLLRNLNKYVPVQEVDTVLFLFREGYYNWKANQVDHSAAEICVAKNRYGECTVLPFCWYSKCDRAEWQSICTNAEELREGHSSNADLF